MFQCLFDESPHRVGLTAACLSVSENCAIVALEHSFDDVGTDILVDGLSRRFRIESRVELVTLALTRTFR